MAAHSDAVTLSLEVGWLRQAGKVYLGPSQEDAELSAGVRQSRLSHATFVSMQVVHRPHDADADADAVVAVYIVARYSSGKAARPFRSDIL